MTEDEEEWEYGEGMTLIKPRGSGYIIPASSQTGTWAEDKLKSVVVPTPDKPILRSHKSQRLDLTSTPAIAEETNLVNGVSFAPVSSATNGTNGPTGPTVDDFTRHLGIGWSSVSTDEDIQAAVRGWSKFIENHFPVTDAKILLQSKGLASYLVEAKEGYFLFGEDLKQGRLVSQSLERTWLNLRGAVPVFDGGRVMVACATPKSNGGMERPLDGTVAEGIGAEQVALNGNHESADPVLEVEMDMS